MPFLSVPMFQEYEEIFLIRYFFDVFRSFYRFEKDLSNIVEHWNMLVTAIFTDV
jgi:hypothetical protein